VVKTVSSFNVESTFTVVVLSNGSLPMAASAMVPLQVEGCAVKKNKRVESAEGQAGQSRRKKKAKQEEERGSQNQESNEPFMDRTQNVLCYSPAREVMGLAAYIRRERPKSLSAKPLDR
jgi:hypothetical protein